MLPLLVHRKVILATTTTTKERSRFWMKQSRMPWSKEGSDPNNLKQIRKFALSHHPASMLELPEYDCFGINHDWLAAKGMEEEEQSFPFPISHGRFLTCCDHCRPFWQDKSRMAYWKSWLDKRTFTSIWKLLITIHLKKRATGDSGGQVMHFKASCYDYYGMRAFHQFRQVSPSRTQSDRLPRLCSAVLFPLLHLLFVYHNLVAVREQPTSTPLCLPYC